MLKRLLCLFILCFTAIAHAEDAMQTTNVHNLITKHSGWLNTSRPLTAEDLKGRIILLDFWTYCCINCMHVIPDLKYLEDKFGDKLTVIGVHSAKFQNEKDSENIRQAILRYDLHHPVVNDFDFSTWQSFGIHAWPTFVLINPKGIIETMYSGEGNRERAEYDIAQLIKKYDGRINTGKLPIALEKDKAPPTVLSFPGKLIYVADLQGKPVLMISDSGHQRMVVTDMDGTIIDTIGSGKTGLTDGSFAEASFNTPQGLAYKDGKLYIADTNNHALRLADLAARTVTTIAGTGEQGYVRAAKNKPARQVPLASPWDVTFFPDDMHLTIAMAGTHQLWSYDIDKKTVSVIAGNGNESIDDGRYPDNSLSQPSGLSAVGSKLYFVDAETSSLRVFEDGAVKTLIGTGLFDFGYKEGKQGTARMQHPLGLYATDKEVYVADAYNHSIRRYDIASEQLLNFAGHGVRGSKDGAAEKAEFNEPNAIAMADGKLYVADTNNNAIRVIDGGKVETLEVREAERPSLPMRNSELPNLEKIDAVTVDDGPIDIVIQLQPGWHINDEAPSYLALFDDTPQIVPAPMNMTAGGLPPSESITLKPQAVAAFWVNDIKGRKIPWTPVPGRPYHLQGTLYYCEDKAGSQCLLKSFDIPLTVKKGGKKALTLPLN